MSRKLTDWQSWCLNLLQNSKYDMTLAEIREAVISSGLQHRPGFSVIRSSLRERMASMVKSGLVRKDTLSTVKARKGYMAQGDSALIYETVYGASRRDGRDGGRAGGE